VALEHIGVEKEIYFGSWKSARVSEWKDTGGYESALQEMYPEMPTVEAFEGEGLRPPSVYDVWKLVQRDVFEVLWKEKERAWVINRITVGEEILQRAHFDFDNDGDTDTVYRRGLTNVCREAYPVSKNAEVPYTPTEGNLETSWVIHAFDGGGDEPTGALLTIRNMDVFTFRSRTYLDGWNHNPGLDESAPFHVYKITGYEPHPQALMTSVCGFTVSTEQWHR
jgi:hypothetical protein